jgi:hypothetical protein
LSGESCCAAGTGVPSSANKPLSSCVVSFLTWDVALFNASILTRGSQVRILLLGSQHCEAHSTTTAFSVACSIHESDMRTPSGYMADPPTGHTRHMTDAPNLHQDLVAVGTTTTAVAFFAVALRLLTRVHVTGNGIQLDDCTFSREAVHTSTANA